MRTVIGLILFSISLGVMGQFFFKAGVTQAGGKLPIGPAMVMIFFKPLVFAGLVCYAVSTITWLAALSRAQLSFVYPLISISYILVMLVGVLFFHEQVPWTRWMGVLLICLGVACFMLNGQAAISGSHSPPATPAAVTASAPALPEAPIPDETARS